MKYIYLLQSPTLCSVAPLVGAWIEINIITILYIFCFVAPLVGAWIEIDELGIKIVKNESLPSWERGLKSLTEVVREDIFPSLPSWERGLKFPFRIIDDI